MRVFILLFGLLGLHAPLIVASDTMPQYERVYSVQVASYQSPSYAQRVASEHTEIPFLCRERENGLFVLYYGVFEQFSDARLHLRDYDLFSDVNAYVVKLENVTFSPCDTFGERIKESRGKAFSRRACADCDLDGLVESFLPDF